MTLGQLPAETVTAWWIREHRVTVTSDGKIVYDPMLWWPMEILKRIGRAYRRVRYSWRPVRVPRVESGKVRTYRGRA